MCIGQPLKFKSGERIAADRIKRETQETFAGNWNKWSVKRISRIMYCCSAASNLIRVRQSSTLNIAGFLKIALSGMNNGTS